MYKFLPSSSLSGIYSLIIIPLFATGVIDTGGKFPAGIVDTGGKVTTTHVKLVAKLAAGVVDTGWQICRQCR
jgi:hypothetical protein